MELFRRDGCLSDEGLQALLEGKLDELGRLEAAEHLSYCNKCLDRYTGLLTGEVLKQPPRDLSRPVGRTILIRLMQNLYGRIAVAGVAAVLALTLWESESLQLILERNAASLEPWESRQMEEPAAPELPPKSNYTEPPRPGERMSVAQKAQEAVSELWDALSDAAGRSDESD